MTVDYRHVNTSVNYLSIIRSFFSADWNTHTLTHTVHVIGSHTVQRQMKGFRHCDLDLTVTATGMFGRGVMTLLFAFYIRFWFLHTLPLNGDLSCSLNTHMYTQHICLNADAPPAARWFALGGRTLSVHDRSWWQSRQTAADSLARLQPNAADTYTPIPWGPCLGHGAVGFNTWPLASVWPSIADLYFHLVILWGGMPHGCTCSGFHHNSVCKDLNFLWC